MITLSIVIPATDAPPTLPSCRASIDTALAALDRRRPPTNAEVIEVTGPAALSAAAARNRGARQATGDVVVFVDADVTVHPDALIRMVDAFEADADLTALFGSYDDTPAARSTVSTFRNLLHHHVHHDNAGRVDTFWTGLGAIRRADFLAAGGFDEDRYPHPSVEDIELGDRLSQTGLRIELDPTIQGTHLKRWTLASMIHTDFARRAMPWIAMQVRNRRLSTALNLGWRHRISAVAAVAMVTGVAVMPWRVPLGVLAVCGAGGVLTVLNRNLYRLLASRLGLVRGAASVGLHVLHHLVAVAALPIGVVAALAPGNAADRAELLPAILDMEEAA